MPAGGIIIPRKKGAFYAASAPSKVWTTPPPGSTI
jgi:hypothetical protein